MCINVHGTEETYCVCVTYNIGVLFDLYFLQYQMTWTLFQENLNSKIHNNIWLNHGIVIKEGDLSI